MKFRVPLESCHSQPGYPLGCSCSVFIMVIIIAYECAVAFQVLNIYSEGHGGAYSARWIDAVGACLGGRFLFPLNTRVWEPWRAVLFRAGWASRAPPETQGGHHVWNICWWLSLFALVLVFLLLGFVCFKSPRKAFAERRGLGFWRGVAWRCEPLGSLPFRRGSLCGRGSAENLLLSF